MLSENVKKYRLAKKWSLEKLARETNMSMRSIASLENGETQFPRLNTLEAVSKALDIGIDELIK